MATKAIATQFPEQIHYVRHMSMGASTPRISVMPSIGSRNVVRVPARITSEALVSIGTATTPLLVSMSVSVIVICVPSVM